ncbi:Inner membrane protein yaaH [Citrobacter freundii]|nr:Inner membrane protein yaaH [Citrobacter freundii]
MGNTKLANPAPLGLMGFGMTTILLNLHNAGFFALDVIILAMGHFLRRYRANFCRTAGI